MKPTLQEVAKKQNGLYTYEYSKYAAAKDLNLSKYMFDRMSEQAYVVGKIDANAGRITYCSLYYLKEKALKAMKISNTECADACIRGLDLETLNDVLSFNRQDAINNCMLTLDINDVNVAKVVIWALIAGDKMEKMFEKVRKIGIYLRSIGLE